MTQTNTVTIAQALASNAQGLIVSDTAIHIAAALPNASLVARVTSFNVAVAAIVTVPQLLALATLGTALHAGAGVLTLNSAGTVSVAQLTAMEGTPGFILGAAASLTLSDTTAHVAALLASHPAWFSQLAALSVQLDGTSIGAYPAVQLNNFANHKPITFVPTSGNTTLNVAAAGHDLGSNAASLNQLATHTAISFALTNDGASLIASDAAGLATLAGFSPAAHTLYVSDTAANIAAHPNLFGAGFATIQVMSGTLAGTASQLADPTLRFLGSAHAQLATNATVSVQTANALIALPGFSVAAGVQLAVSDTASNLAVPAPAWLAYASAVTVNASATITASAAANLASLSTNFGASFSLGGHSLTIADTLANLLALPNAATALATAIALSANATANAGQVAAFAALPHSSPAGFSIAVSDTAANLLALSAPALADTASQTLTADAMVNAASYVALRAMPHFGLAGHALGIVDTASNLLAITGSPALASTTALSANAQVSAAQLNMLAALPGFSVNGHMIAVADTAPALLALAPSALALVSSTSLSADATVTAAQAATLASDPAFATAGHHLTIADNAANLAGLAPNVAAFATAETLTAPATLSAAAAVALTAAPGFSVAPGVALTITDTLTALLALPAQTSSLAANLVLSANATATATQVMAFAALPQATLGSHTIAVADTAANLLALSGSALADTAQASLSADAAINVSQLTALAALPGFSANGHAISVTDTAANLLGLSNAARSFTTALMLSADATLNAAQAATLLAEPGYTPNAHHLTIVDSAANLLALPVSAQAAASTLALSASQTVSASQLAQLAAFGTKFSEAAHTLTCTDTAANLAALSPGALALVSAEILSAPGTVTASMAAALAALPNLSQVPGATLTIQDNVANLLALGNGEPAITGIVQLAPASVVTISAAQAHALALVPHFTVGSAQITVADTIAGFAAPANTGWQLVAGATQVTDTAANLAANAGNPLVQTAGAVTLSANAQINASTAAQIATIPHFASFPFALTVSDTASAIAARAGAINAVATGAVVTDSGPISVTVADQLAVVSAAGKLTFQGGDQLLVQDTYAALINPANASGYALAARVGVVDTAANLVTASAHNWNALNPTYTLSGGGLVSAAQAQTLAGLGAHYANGGYTLQMLDSASAVVGAASALATLGITANVVDSAANLGANEFALQGMGAEIAVIHTTDFAPVSAAVAAGIAGLASKLSGPALHVADTASAVDAALSGLTTLATHVTVAVTDSAAAIAAVATDLAELGNVLIVNLTDSSAVTAAIAAGLSPVASHLAALTALAVTDTGGNIAAHAPALLALIADLGTITLSDGTTQTAATAAALAPLDSHLGLGVQLSVTGTAAALTANEAGLLQLAADGHLATIVLTNITVADALANQPALAALPTSVSITDSAANVDAGLNGLSLLGTLSNITLNDGGTPALAMSIGTLSADAGVLAKISSAYTVTIVDSAANITADLVSGSASVLAAHHLQLGAITVSDNLPVTLTEAQLLAPGIDDGPSAALAHFAGTLNVTGVDIAHLAQVLGLYTPPNGVTVNDTSADISADLAQGSNALLVMNAAHISHFASSDGAPIVLTAAQALAAGVDDGASSPLGLLVGAHLSVTGATIAQLPALANLALPPSTITISDTAADIAADLAQASPALLANLPLIGTITVSDGQPIALTQAQALAAGIDDGAGSVLSKIAGAQLTVSGVDIADCPRCSACRWPRLASASPTPPRTSPAPSPPSPPISARSRPSP